MSKRLLFLLGLLLSMTAADAQDRTATEVINDMAPGWNLGNTFEGVATWAGADFLNNGGGLQAETAWQGTKTTQEIIDYILYAKEKGCQLTGPEDEKVERLNVIKESTTY